MISFRLTASRIAVLLHRLRDSGGGMGRLSLVDGCPTLGEEGLAVLVPADTSNREIAGQSDDYAEQLLERRAA